MSRECCSFGSSDAGRGDTPRHRALLARRRLPPAPWSQRAKRHNSQHQAPSTHKNQGGVFDLRALLLVLLLEFACTLAASSRVANGEYTSAQVSSCTPPGARPRQLSRNREARNRVGAVASEGHFGGGCLLCLHQAANSALLWRWMQLCCDAAVIPADRHSPDRIPGTMIFLVDCVCALGKTTGARDSLAPQGELQEVVSRSLCPCAAENARGRTLVARHPSCSA